MSIVWNPFAVGASLFPARTESASKKAHLDACARWQRAAARDPDLVADLIRLGGVLCKQPDILDGENLRAIDPLLLAKLEGRREFALELLALTKTDTHELSNMMENYDDLP